MKELWLNFKDEKGEAKRVLVEGEKFAIGRTPDNDLQIPLSSLSRQHVKIERFADVFIISDCGSSNGSKLNDEPLEKPIALKHDDKLNLGDAIEIEIEIPSDKKEKGADGGGVGSTSTSGADKVDESGATPSSSAAAAKSSSAATASSSAGLDSSKLWLFMLAPILMILVLLGLGGAILIARSKKEPEIVKKDPDFIDSKDDDVSENNDKKTPEKTVTSTPITTPTSNSGGTSTPINSTPAASTPDGSEINTPTPKTSSETEKIKFASAAFLRRVAGNDPNAFLLEKQIAILNPKINQFKGSADLAENIKNAKSNSSKIAEMAKSKNLKPQFLATAALAKLGKQRGDVATTAQGMLEILDNLSIQNPHELAEENLVVIAAYEQGAAGENLKMRDKVAKLTKKFPTERSQTIRTIWFLKEHGELSDSEFNFALQFLAIGTITQSPKDFNVSAEPLIF